MMREILFRGKRLDNDEWVYGSFCMDALELKNGLCGVDGFIRLYDSGKGKMQMHEVDRETVGQYTGLTDKNGRKVFEGDICRVCLDPEICTGKVFWDDKIASYNILLGDGECVLPLDLWFAQNDVGDKVWIEIIGNIHDNPELLDQ